MGEHALSKRYASKSTGKMFLDLIWRKPKRKTTEILVGSTLLWTENLNLRLRKPTSSGGKNTGHSGCPPASSGNWLYDLGRSHTLSWPRVHHLKSKEWGMTAKVPQTRASEDSPSLGSFMHLCLLHEELQWIKFLNSVPSWWELDYKLIKLV